LEIDRLARLSDMSVIRVFETVGCVN